jgi:magnesium chelatase family protein
VLASIRSANIVGAQGCPITVEVHVANGLPGFTMVGNPDTTLREARDRVRAAVLSSDLPWPNRRITLNFAPAGLRKAGTSLDLAIAVAVLVASGEVPAEAVEGLGFLGEVGLDGSVRRVAGMAPMVASLPAEVSPVVPVGSLREASIATERPVRTIDSVSRLVSVLRGEQPWPDLDEPEVVTATSTVPDLADVRGQQTARTALEIAAAGGHNLFLVGSPGSGKTMLAQRLPGLLPVLDGADSLAVTMVHSASGVALPPEGMVRIPPFRAPHHTSSYAGMVGGGTHLLQPGEASLAHCGVLFLDEMGEFAPTVLDGLRQPLEDGVVRIARAHARATLPARFLLVGASNPCPCGGGPPGACECDDGTRARYGRRVSGPLLDRFDLRVVVRRPDVDQLLGIGEAEPTALVARRVSNARAVAIERQGCLNSAVPGDELDLVAPVDPTAHALLRCELEADKLSGRGYHRVRRVARTIADLEGWLDPISDRHVAAALLLRSDVLGTRRWAA